MKSGGRLRPEALEPLSERQEYILALLVRRFVETGEPVGSKRLVESFDLDVSSATVRSELASLDALGYLTQLHTSAGRLPTELGYRYFVQRLLGELELPQEERHMIRHQFHQARLDLLQWMRLAAAVLAHTSRVASLVTAPRPTTDRFKHVQLIATQGRLVLMILVFSGGQVRQQMLTLAEPVAQSRLTAVAERLNSLYENADLDDIAGRQSALEDELERDVTRLVLDWMESADKRSIGDMYHDGLANILEHEGARQVVRVLEEGTLMRSVLAEMLGPDMSGVQVVIGGEGRWEELRDCTMILARYGDVSHLSGAVAVLGPTRMPYGRNISAVRYVADLMSSFVNEYYLEFPTGDAVAPNIAIDEVEDAS
ncbi:MAG: heat-inducible transcriptional repressor HrcA [Candidatus Promineifilaceae bacterium]